MKKKSIFHTARKTGIKEGLSSRINKQNKKWAKFPKGKFSPMDTGDSTTGTF
jgi:hypothetical protein